MKNIALIILLFILAGCQTLEKTTEQCTVDLAESKCYCRQYQFSIDYLGGITGSLKEMPFDHCNKLVGFTDYVDVATFWEKVRREIVESKKEKKDER